MAPVIIAAPGETRKAVRSAMSSGTSRRPNGCVAPTAAAQSFRQAVQPSLHAMIVGRHGPAEINAEHPDPLALQRICRPLVSATSSALVSATSAAFDAE